MSVLNGFNSLVKRALANDLNLVNRVHNRHIQLWNPDLKIFVIGFNKCGTRSLHIFCRKNGIRSIHWGGPDDKRNLAAIMKRNIEQGANPLKGIDRYTAFSDMSYLTDEICIEGCLFFKEFFRH